MLKIITAKTLPLILTGAALLFISIAYLTFTVIQTSESFVTEFERQNMVEVNQEDIMALTFRLNSLSGTVPWVCIEAGAKGQIFLSRVRGNCNSSLFQHVVSVKTPPRSKLWIKFTLTLPDYVKRAATILLLVQFAMIFLLFWSVRAITEAQLATSVQTSKLAEQVAHDIQSPLAAIEMISHELIGIGETKNAVLRSATLRIKEIVSSIAKSNNIESGIVASLSDRKESIKYDIANTEPVLLAAVVESIVSEKWLEYKSYPGIEIHLEITDGAHELFARVESNELKRVLSNLINNAVESYHPPRGTVNVTLVNEFDHAEILVIDEGSGIPKEIQSRIGVRGITFGKDKGSGLGLAHAISSASNWGGAFRIDSTQGAGTRAKLKLPAAPPPWWYASKLVINKNSQLIIIDDDESVHSLWAHRYNQNQMESKGIKILNFRSGKEFRCYYSKHFTELDRAVLLFDYQFHGEIDTGLDIIEQLHVHKQSLLVTGRFEEAKVRSGCRALGLKIIPKNYSGLIPIELA